MSAGARLCPNCGAPAITVGEQLVRGGTRFPCRACGEPLTRSLWIVPVQIVWAAVFFAGLLFVVSRESTSSVAVFLGLMTVAAVAVGGARYVGWRWVPVRRAPAGRALAHRAALAMVPGLVVGFWVLVWSHTRPVLAAALAFAVVWAAAFLSGGSRRS